jgi:hypothetical protein
MLWSVVKTKDEHNHIDEWQPPPLLKEFEMGMTHYIGFLLFQQQPQGVFSEILYFVR